MAFGGAVGGTIPVPLGLTLEGSGTNARVPPNAGSKNSLVYQRLSLSSFQAFPPQSAAPDTGVFDTAVPAATDLGLPTNFGPGRDNWKRSDARFMRFEIESQNYAAGP
jgi:hypothetical protein